MTSSNTGWTTPSNGSVAKWTTTSEINYYAIKAYKGMEVSLHSFLTSAIGGGEESLYQRAE
jgi:hypothetical protein